MINNPNDLDDYDFETYPPPPKYEPPNYLLFIGALIVIAAFVAMIFLSFRFS